MSSKTLRNQRHVRGMTLIEVLVALAIFATAAVSVVRAVTQHINSIAYLEDKAFAAMVADNQMAMVMLSKPKQSSKGESEFAGRVWYWQVDPVETESAFLRAVDVSVAKDKERNQPLVTVRSYVPR